MSANVAHRVRSSTPTYGVRPMHWLSSLLHFGIPALALVLAFHGVMPWLVQRGMSFFYAYALSLGVLLTGLLIAALLATRAEGSPLQWSALRMRWRLHGMNWRAWLWTLGAFLVAFAAYGMLAAVQRALAIRGVIPIPDNLPPFLDPRQSVSGDNIDQLFGNIRGNWLALIVFVALLFVNIAGEEAWWRGYVLPRQELAFGRWTWLVHGLMWNLFHVFKWWDLLALLPVTLLLSFLVVRLRNNTPGVVLHTLFNAMGILPLLLGIMGAGR